MDDVLLEALAAGAQVVTPTRRLARHLTLCHNTAQLAAGRSAWRSADVLPWDAWIGVLFDRARDRTEACPHLLGAGQERELWRELIRASNPDVDTGSLTRLVREAWRLQHEWGMHPSRAGGGSGDVEAYAEWSRRFAARCRRRGWITRAEICDWLASERLYDIDGRHLVFYAFDRFAPQQNAVLEACARAGATVRVLDAPVPRNNAVHHGYDDPLAEMTGVAQQARALLDAGRAGSIGIVVPDLSAQRARWLAVLDAVFDPVVDPAREAGIGGPYNLSLGAPLQTWPAVRTLLLLLRFAVDELPLAQVGELLSSPYVVAGEREFHDRALFDALLRERGGLVLQLEEFVHLLRSHRAATGRCAALESSTSSLLTASRGLHGSRPPSQWLEVFHRVGDLCGWPGERTLDSTEMQLVERCRAAMSELATYDIVTGPVGVKQALGLLARVFEETVFQPESPDVPVQILGVLESAGIEFDCLFVTGLSDQSWPPAAHPNVLLPIGVQRSLGVPHSSVEWEWDFSRRMMAMWTSTAGAVQYSSVRRRDDRPMRPSVLLRGLPQPEGSDETQACSYTAAIFESRRFDAVADEFVPVPDSPLPMRGGASVLKHQSDCPFRAFAIHRLGARELEEGRVGLDARDRGVLVHAVMDAFSRQVTSSHQLHSLSEGDAWQRISSAVQEGLAALVARRGHLMPEAFRVTETARLRRLLGAFVELERQRPSFRVLSRESARQFHINSLTLTGRPDRIDEIESGAEGASVAIIDYKTGRMSARDWFGLRPAEPQLPLYALAQTSPVAAVAFVNLSAERVAWTGVGVEEDLVAGVVTPSARITGDAALLEWHAVLRHWREVLTRLAGDFAAGVASVDPRDGRKTCRNCRLETLCRIDAAQVLADEGEDDAES